jgi:protein TonB
MRSDNILKTDLLDLVFENRNKQYGAYELRKNYQKRLTGALLVGFILAAGICSLLLMTKKGQTKVPDFVFSYDMAPTPELLPLPEKPKIKPAAPKAPSPAPSKPQQMEQYSRIEIVDNPLLASKLPTDLDNSAIGGRPVEGTPGGQVFVPDPIVINGDGSPKPTPAVDKETPRFTADIMPSYPGGTAALRKFLERNLNSPEELEEGRTVTVKVKFIVGYDGKLKGFEILEDGGAAFNKEVIRVLKKMPEWEPGKSNGENVSVFFTIPVKFTPSF